MKHTTGEWRWDERDEPENSIMPYSIVRPYGSACIPIADIAAFPPNTTAQLEQMKANAILIATAPELLEALQECVKELRFHNWHNSTTCYAAEAAIKKATTCTAN